MLGTVYGATRYRMRARYRADGTRKYLTVNVVQWYRVQRARYRADDTLVYHTVNVVYNGIEYRGPGTGLMTHLSTTQSM